MIDITELLFETENMDLEDRVRLRLFHCATKEVEKTIHDLPLLDRPVFKYDYINKTYREYLKPYRLEYDEERGF